MTKLGELTCFFILNVEMNSLRNHGDTSPQWHSWFD